MEARPRLLSEVRFGAFLVYSPRGTSEKSQQSRVWCYDVKYDRHPGIARAAEELARLFEGTPLARCLGPDVTLIPAPKSSPLVEGALWPARRIAEELVRRGLAKDVLPCVRREVAVPKSSFAAPGDRPRARAHLDSLSVEPVLAHPARLTVVDDIVTKGATLLAVASLVKYAFPEADIASFAMVRTLGLQPEIDRVIDPCVGVIKLSPWGETDRLP